MVRRYHLWLVTKDETGKPYLIYGAPDFGTNGGEAIAREKGLSMLGGLDFEIKRYPTSDLGTASAYHRGKRLERGEGLKASVQRLGHDRSLKRLKRRRLRL